MGDNYEHKKPYSLTASYLDIVEPSPLTAPYDLHAVYDPDLAANYVREQRLIRVLSRKSQAPICSQLITVVMSMLT